MHAGMITQENVSASAHFYFRDCKKKLAELCYACTDFFNGWMSDSVIIRHVIGLNRWNVTLNPVLK